MQRSPAFPHFFTENITFVKEISDPIPQDGRRALLSGRDEISGDTRFFKPSTQQRRSDPVCRDGCRGFQGHAVYKTKISEDDIH